MVYIDNFNAPYRRMKMCHMIADTTDELIGMAELCGVSRKWIQEPATYNEHFDICLSAKSLALSNGATEINFRGYARMVNRRLNNINAKLICNPEDLLTNTSVINKALNILSDKGAGE